MRRLDGEKRDVTEAGAATHGARVVSILLAAIAAIVSLSHASAADEKVAAFGNWSIFTWVEDDGSIPACYASVEYRTGTRLYVVYGVEDGYEIMLRNPSWTLREDETYPVSIEIDRMGAWDADLYAVSTETVHVYVNEDFIEEFKRGFEMRIEGRNQNLYFSLSGTTRAVDAVQECERRYATRPSSNPFGDGTGQAANPFGDGSAGGSGNAAADDDPMTMEDARNVMEVLVDEVIGDRRFRSVRMIDADEYEDIFDEFDLRWTNGDVIGAAAVSPLPAGEQSSTLLSSDARVCDGKFGSVRDDVEVDDGITVIQLGLVCDGVAPWGVGYLIIPADDFSIVVAHVSDDIALAQEFDNNFLGALIDFVRSLEKT
jgi:hypothetical protein